MIKGSLAKRYARALMAIGQEKQIYERLGNELGVLAGLAATDANFRMVIKTPTFSREARAKVLQKVGEAIGAHEVMLHFLALLNDKGRLLYLEQIHRAYLDQIDEVLGRVRASVVSASTLSPESEQRIKAALTKITGKDVIMTAEVDPSLIGGVVTRVAGKLFDGSVKTQLKAMEERLKTAGEL